jgi:DNA-binding HxlR family transcriptional regulator
VSSYVGGIQPDLLPDLADAAQREDGFLDRLLWSFPGPVADRWTDHAVRPDLEREVGWVFLRLYRLGLSVSGQARPSSTVVRLGPEAAARWKAWYDAHTTETAAETFPRRLRGPWAKMPAQLARLTLILHALSDPMPAEVAVETLGAAIDLIDYFKSHARRVHRHLGQQRRDLAVRVLQALKERGESSQSDLLRDVFQRNVPAERLRAALEQLEDAGLVRRRVDEKEGPGRRATLWSAV